MPKETKTTSKTKIIISSLIGVAILGSGVMYYHNATANIANQKTQIVSLKKAISDTKDANAKAKAKNEKASKANNTPAKTDDVIKSTQSQMDFAATFVLNYIKSMEDAQSTDAIKTLNKTYLADNAKIPVIVGGGDDGKIANNIFGGDKNQIKTVPSMPNSNDQIIVYAYSDNSPKVSFRATYDINQKKIINTHTYSINK